jgi:hypothetical protein
MVWRYADACSPFLLIRIGRKTILQIVLFRIKNKTEPEASATSLFFMADFSREHPADAYGSDFFKHKKSAELQSGTLSGFVAGYIL